MVMPHEGLLVIRHILRLAWAVMATNIGIGLAVLIVDAVNVILGRWTWDWIMLYVVVVNVVIGVIDQQPRTIRERVSCIWKEEG